MKLNKNEFKMTMSIERDHFSNLQSHRNWMVIHHPICPLENPIHLLLQQCVNEMLILFYLLKPSWFSFFVVFLVHFVACFDLHSFEKKWNWWWFDFPKEYDYKTIKYNAFFNGLKSKKKKTITIRW